MASDGEFKIEKGVPVPSGYNVGPRYPLLEMGVNDSFLVPFGGDDALAVKNRVSKAVYGKHQDRKFTIRQVEGGVRVWRIA